jgi:hypothetical protein
MEAKHTKGPWTTARDNHITLGIPGFGDREDMRIVSGNAQGMEQDVAYVRAVDDDNGNANAALMAAAPEMYEALQGLLSIMYEHPEHGLCTGPRASEEIEAARSALSKAVPHD